MDSSPLTQKDKDSEQCKSVSFLALLGEALGIPIRNIHFTGITLITSLPLLFLTIFFQILLESSLHDLLKLERPFLSPLEWTEWYIPYNHFYAGIENLTKVFSEKLLFLSLIYLIPLPLLQYLAAYLTIYLTSKVYKNGNTNSSKQRMKHIKGVLVTSLIVHLLSTTLFMGFLWLSIVLYGCNLISFYDIAFIVIYLASLAMLIPKYLEVSAMLNLSLVVSVLGEIHGIDALVMSMRFSKGKEKFGCYLMMVFFVWEFVLRIPCLLFDDGEVGIIVRSTLLWLGSLMKWVVCVVYCYECMGDILEKRMTSDNGGSGGREEEKGKILASVL